MLYSLKEIWKGGKRVVGKVGLIHLYFTLCGHVVTSPSVTVVIPAMFTGGLDSRSKTQRYTHKHTSHRVTSLLGATNTVC